MRLPLFIFILALTLRAPAAAPTPEQAEFFEKKIRPLLSETCFKCHSAQSEKLKAELYADSRAGLLKGGETGPAIVPGDPEKSLLIKAVRYADPDLQMPPKKRLTEEQVADLVAWVKMDAPWPGGDAPSAAPATAKVSDFDLKKRRADHWAWQPVRAQKVPDLSAQSKQPALSTSPVDAFILEKLFAIGLVPAAQADKRTLIRRATFDLNGLPPTPEEVDAFLRDESPAAFARVVDRLLASPQFGERWARHWLDLVRYAESLGHEFDFTIPNAWRYRDYVIRAINADVPFNQFAVEHIAGDLLPQPRRAADGTNESLIGTGFFWLMAQTHSPVDVRNHEAELIDNQIDVFGKTFLGLTVACARCHDHKFDAISTRDYYALAGIFESARFGQRSIDAPAVFNAKARALFDMKGGIRAAVGAVWQREASRVAEYLLAARALSSKENARPVAGIAASKNPDAALVERWSKVLGEKEAKSPAHPLHLWTVLAAEDDAKLGARWPGVLDALKKMRADATKPRNAYTAFAGFSEWFTDGNAFAARPGVAGDFVVGDAAQPIASVWPAGWMHSGFFSRRLQGVLRSPVFTVEKRYVHIRAAGQDARINLVLENFHLIRAPIYGGLKHELKIDEPHWQVFDLEMWKGRRAYLEFSDLGVADFGGEEHGNDGTIACDRVFFSDESKPPQLDAPASLALLGESQPDTAETLAHRYAQATLDAVKAWQAGTANDAQIVLLDWLARHRLLDAAPDARVVALVEAYRKTEAAIPAPTLVPAMTEGGGFDERVSIRGNYKTPGDLAPRRFLEAIAGAQQPPVAHGSGRVELARQLVAADNPLTVRVAVNNVWHHLFGRGIVPTPDNFGVLGERPTHPELLDWLAAHFVSPEIGWSRKKLIRELMLTRAYQMSGESGDALAEQKDPTDALLHRARVRRLEGEAIRDSVLAVSGRLDKTQFGPPVPVHLTAFMDGRGKPGESGPLDGAGRRSLYIAVRRNFLPPMLLAFDAPVPATTVARRTSSNVPAQALILMNDPFIAEQANFWAKRLLLEKMASPQQRVARIYNEAFARPPTDAETRAALEFIEQQGLAYTSAGAKPDEEKVWTDLCHVVFNVKEFIFIQ